MVKNEMGIRSKAGLLKLVEECGELTQIAMKQAAFMNTDDHPDDNGHMSLRLEDEMGDVLAAIQLVAFNRELDWESILQRMEEKVAVFLSWQHGGKPSDYDREVWSIYMPFLFLKKTDAYLSEEQEQNIVEMRQELMIANE